MKKMKTIYKSVYMKFVELVKKNNPTILDELIQDDSQNLKDEVIKTKALELYGMAEEKAKIIKRNALTDAMPNFVALTDVMNETERIIFTHEKAIELLIEKQIEINGSNEINENGKTIQFLIYELAVQYLRKAIEDVKKKLH